MGLTVRKALSIGGLSRARVVGGSSGLDRVIRYVDIIEVPDFASWLRPNVFSITCAYAIKDNPRAQVDLVRNLARCNAAGLAVKPGRFLGSMPVEMIRAADEEGIPLIEIPTDLSYIEVTHPLQSAIIDEELRDSKFQLDVHRTIVDLMVREKGVVSIVETLANLLERNVYVLDDRATVVAGYGRFSGHFRDERHVCEWAGGLASSLDAPGSPSRERPSGGPATWSCDEADVFGVGSPNDDSLGGREHRRLAGFVVVDVGGKGRLRFAETAMAYQAAVAIGLEMASARLMKDTRRRVMAEFLAEILTSGISPASEEAAKTKASFLGIDLDEPYAVAVMRTTSTETGSVPSTWLTAETMNRVEKHLEETRKSSGIKASIAAYDPGLIAICTPVPPAGSSSGEKERGKVKGKEEGKDSGPVSAAWDDPDVGRVVGFLEGLSQDQAVGVSLSIGISSMQSGVSGIATGYSQAVQALQLGASRKRPSSVVRFDPTSPYVLLQGLSRQHLEHYFAAVLGRLDNDRTLLYTLKVFLEQGCQSTRAASTLFVHRNTLTYRLKSIEGKLCCDLRDPDVQVRIRLALLAGTLTGKVGRLSRTES